MIIIDDAGYGRFSRHVSSRGALRVVSAPTAEPLSIAQAIAHLRENVDDVDTTDLQAKITEARAIIEDLCGRALAPQLLELATRCFPGGYPDYSRGMPWNEFELPMPPVIAIDSITYLDSTGTDQAMAAGDYRLDFHSQPAVVYLPYGSQWPTAQYERNSVRIRYLAGYDLPGNSPDNNPLPPALLAAMKLMLGHLWENREHVTDVKLDEIPMGVHSLLVQYQTRVAIA